MLHQRLSNFTTRYHWLVVILSVLLLLALAKGMTRLTFSNDYWDYFSEANPQLLEWEKLQKVFNKTDNVFISVTAKQGDVFTPEHLSVLKALTEQGWQMPYASRVDSIINFQHVRPLGEDDLEISDLVMEVEGLTPSQIQEVKTIATEHPMLVTRLINKEGSTTAVNVEVVLSEKPRDEIAEISEYAYNLKAEYSEKYPDLQFHITGSVPYNFALTDATKKDIAGLLPSMYVLVLVLFTLFTRSFFATLAVWLLMVFSIIGTMGASGWAGVVLMAPSLSAPTIVMTMAVANAVHMVITFFSYYRGDALKIDAIKKTLETNFSPVVITNLTTAIGFLTMNLSDVPPYQDLGNMVAGGLILVVLFTLFLLPALLHIFPVKPKKADFAPSPLYGKLAEWVIGNYRKIIVGFVAIAFIAPVGISKLELNDRFIEWLDTRYEFRNDSDFINTNLTGLYRLDWGLESGKEGGIADPDYLRRLDALTDWARAQYGVVHVDSMSEIFKELNQKFHGGDPAYYRIPDSQELAAQLLLMYELSLPMGLDLNNMVNVSKSSSRFVLRTANLSTVELLALEQSTKDWLKANGTPTMVSEAASTTILFANISSRNIRSLLSGTVVALILISFLLIVPMRSVKFGVLSLVPNLLPAAIGFGVWGLMFNYVGLAISIVVGMTMGVVVDDTVHFMSKYLRNRRNELMAPAQAIIATFKQVGPALLGTTVTLASGFALLAQSGFEVNQQMGALTSMVIVIAFVADFLLLPSLIMLIDREKPARDAVLQPAVSQG